MRKETASVKVPLLSEQNVKILFIKSQVYYSEKNDGYVGLLMHEQEYIEGPNLLILDQLIIVRKPW